MNSLISKCKFLFLVVIVGSLGLLVNCSPQLLVDFSRVSVPEEGGMNFVQHTRDEEAVVGPAIQTSALTGLLLWYAAPVIAISPNGEKLAYISKANDFNNLSIKNIAGGRAIVQRTFNRNVYDMTFSPDGEKIAFTERRGASTNIYLINATAGAAVQQVTSGNTDEIGPQFTNDGSSVYFTREENGRFYLWNVNLNSSLLTQYSEGFTPNLTPDNKNLIVTRNSKDGKGRGEIWMINLEIGTETLILSDPERGFSSPAISPDGNTIVCVGSTLKSTTRPQNLDIYQVNLDGTNLKQLTFHGGHDVSPQWAPDGRSFFFISQRGNEKGEYNVWNFRVSN